MINLEINIAEPKQSSDDDEGDIVVKVDVEIIIIEVAK
jgi:hypothetical protein